MHDAYAVYIHIGMPHCGRSIDHFRSGPPPVPPPFSPPVRPSRARAPDGGKFLKWLGALRARVAFAVVDDASVAGVQRS